MKLTKPLIIKYVSIGVLAVFIASIWTKKKESEDADTGHRDYGQIQATGILRVVTEYNLIGYHMDGDSLAGFHYELISAFAKAKGLRVEITPEMSFESRMNGLCKGTYDVIAYGIPVTSEWKDSLLLTIPVGRSRQILVQRKAGYDSISTYVDSQLDLAHKTLYVEKGSPAILRIRNLSDEIADTIHIQEVGKYGQEQLMALVAHGDIDYAVANEGVASAYIDSFPQLDISTGISFTQLFAWGVGKCSPALKDSLDTWLGAYMESNEYRQLYKKYFRFPAD